MTFRLKSLVALAAISCTFGIVDGIVSSNEDAEVTFEGDYGFKDGEVTYMINLNLEEVILNIISNDQRELELKFEDQVSIKLRLTKNVQKNSYSVVKATAAFKFLNGIEPCEFVTPNLKFTNNDYKSNGAQVWYCRLRTIYPASVPKNPRIQLNVNKLNIRIRERKLSNKLSYPHHSRVRFH